MDNDNLTSLQHLSHENVLEVLKMRYQAHKIYTYSGHTLISINPYVNLPIYGQNVIFAYTGVGALKTNTTQTSSHTEDETTSHASENNDLENTDETTFYPTQEAHIYSMAENALRSLCISSKVTIIISGESGSGKTMNNNFILEYLIKRTNDQEATNLNKNYNFKINEFLIAINPILEAFGNAKTVLNENSSRFGKKLDLFLDGGRIVGAEIHTYLLEKNRVTHVGFGESNFHIFYYLCAYKNLNIDNEFIKEENIKDEHVQKYEEIINCFKILHVENIICIENILMAILYLGSLIFIQTENEILIERNKEFNKLLELLEIDDKTFTNFLLKSKIKTPSETILVNNKLGKVINIRNTLARNLYSELFNYLITTFNKKIYTDKKIYKTITVLDIYGFENFKENSFDQFCINWANEKIQADYVRRMFIDLKNMYKEEEIELENFEYTHEGCIDIFERSCGIVDLINEESCNSFGNEKNLRNKINNYCKEIHVTNDNFTIKHYASNVTYITNGFIEKNNEIRFNIHDMYCQRKKFMNTILEFLFHINNDKELKKPTVLKYFKKSLDELFKAINGSKIYYVRCLKPNQNQTNSFNKDYILKQLKSSGIIETIEISKRTYSHYLFHDEFAERYSILIGDYKIKRGKNRIFMSNETLNLMEKDREIILNEYKNIIQSTMITEYCKIKYKSNLRIILSVLRMYIRDKKIFEKQQEMLKIQNEMENVNDEQHNIVIESNNQGKINPSLSINISENEKDILYNNNEVNCAFKDQINKQSDDLKIDFTMFEQTNSFILNHGQSSITDLRFDANENLIGEEISFKELKGGYEMDKEENIFLHCKNFENNEKIILDLQEKLKNYEKFCKAPCRNCKTMEIKYKYQTEELKKKRIQELEIENYKKKIKELEENIESIKLKENLMQDKEVINENVVKSVDIKNDKPNINVKDTFSVSFTSPYDVFGCLIELFIDFYPSVSTTFLPKNEALAFGQILYQTIVKLHYKNDSVKDLVEMLTNEIRERFIIFERNLTKVCFVVANVIELKRIIIGEKNVLKLTELAFLEIENELNEIITILFKHLCEMLKKNIIEFLPDAIISYQGLKEFYCRERYFSNFFSKTVPTKKLTDILEYSISILQHYHLPEQAWEECINYLLKTINCRSFNGIIVKNEFLSFNRGLQINNNLNEIEKICRDVGYAEGIHNLEHMRGVIKLINFVKAGLSIECILDRCTYLNSLQIMELLSKFKKDERDYIKNELRNYVAKDTKLEKFVCESKVNVFLDFTGVEHKFIVPRYVPSKYIQAILESL
ncbi:Unconventional myosin-Vb [Conglomerata obtusa]